MPSSVSRLDQIRSGSCLLLYSSISSGVRYFFALAFAAGSFHRDGCSGTNLVNVFAAEDIPRHTIRLGALGQGILESRRALLAGTHRVTVVLDDVDYRKLEECSQVQRFMEGTLINSAVS